VEALSSAYSTEVEEKSGEISYRTPSYTDRILWHTLPGLAEGGCVCTEYTQHEGIRSSDHNPVAASFTVQANKGASMASLSATDQSLWACSIFQIKVFDMSWEPAAAAAGTEVHKLEIVFPIQAEDPNERSRKIHSIGAAVDFAGDDAGSDHWKRSWVVPWDKMGGSRGQVYTASTSHHTGMHMLFRLIGKGDAPIAQGVVSLRDIAMAQHSAGFHTSCSLGGRKMGDLCGSVLVSYTDHMQTEADASADNHTLELKQHDPRPSPEPKKQTQLQAQTAITTAMKQNMV